jgi:hypothetical protein
MLGVEELTDYPLCPIVCAQSTTATTTSAGADTGVILNLWWTNQKNGALVGLAVPLSLKLLAQCPSEDLEQSPNHADY